MNMEERRQAILHLIMEHSPIAVSELLLQVDESPATVRRDLSFLEDNGIITRTHGYARYVEPEIVHKIVISDEKVAIAKRAAALVDENDTILLDSGASTLALAQQLANRTDLTILTNSLSVANALSNSNVTVHMTGGYLSGREEALLGPEAENYIRRINVPKLFLSTTGIRGEEGLTCVTPFQANIKRSFIRVAQKVILLAEEAKFHTDALRIFAEFHEIDCIITSAPIADPALRDCLAKQHVEVLVADPSLAH